MQLTEKCWAIGCKIIPLTSYKFEQKSNLMVKTNFFTGDCGVGKGSWFDSHLCFLAWLDRSRPIA